MEQQIEKDEYSADKAREKKIVVAGKLFHLLFSGWNKSLEKTALWYIKKTGTKLVIDDNSKLAINNLELEGKWIIIATHISGVFSDYLPLYAVLWDTILKKSIFYTWSHSIAMNKREFPDYQFRWATPRSLKETKEMMKQLKLDIDKINQEWWYLFIIPSGANTSDDAEFQWIFKKMIANSNDDLPVLVNHLVHTTDRWYKNIAKSLIFKNAWDCNITSQITYALDWKGLNWKESREKYNSLG